MDTRQLAAFCAVVERRSFSQAAEQLGVTQPAVSLQVRALEKRLGTQLLDRSGRRVEPTEAGRRLYRGAQRLLTLEAQVLDELAAEAEGELTGPLAIGASTGPAAIVVPQLLCEFQEAHPGVRVALEVHDTRTVVELVAERRLELGIVGAAPRPRGMQEGAGVRRIVEDELRRLGVRLRDLDVRLELGLQESVRSAVLAGYGVTFISRAAVDADLAAGALAEARVVGMNGRREISLARGTGRVSSRIADGFAEFAQGRAAELAALRTTQPARPV
jgi:DNA-binding transcriptional LysR family regulator